MYVFAFNVITLASVSKYVAEKRASFIQVKSTRKYLCSHSYAARAYAYVELVVTDM